MELKWLVDYLSLVETRSFSRSAQERCVTQPAFGRRIRSLELWLGTMLLDRSTTPITLTEEGRRFREVAEEVVRIINTSREDLQRVDAPNSLPIITITTLHALCLTFLPQWLMQLRGQIGPIGTRVQPENFHTCVQSLIEGGYDLFLTFHHASVPTPLSPDLYPHLVVGHDKLLAVASPEVVRLPNGKLPLLQYTRGSYLGLLSSVAQTKFGPAAVQPVHIHENSMAEALKFMALAGHGVAWLPQSLVAAEIANGSLTVFAPELPMEIRLYRSASRSRPLLDRVWQATDTHA